MRYLEPKETLRRRFRADPPSRWGHFKPSRGAGPRLGPLRPGRAGSLCPAPPRLTAIYALACTQVGGQPGRSAGLGEFTQDCAAQRTLASRTHAQPQPPRPALQGAECPAFPASVGSTPNPPDERNPCPLSDLSGRARRGSRRPRTDRAPRPGEPTAGTSRPRVPRESLGAGGGGGTGRLPRERMTRDHLF